MRPILSVLALIIFLCPAQQASAQCADSIAARLDGSATACPRLRPAEVAVPAAIVAFTAYTARNGWLRKKRDVVQDALSPRNGIHTRIDNYIQYAPLAAGVALNLAEHDRLDRIGVQVLGMATMTLLTQGLKHTVRERRPDTDARNSFPSGHTATAFLGAELLRMQSSHISPWIGYSGYAVAAATAYLRIYNNRHYLNDVLGGAAIGFFSARFAAWAYPRIFRRGACRRTAGATVACMPFAADGGGYGACLSVTF
ncbi:MAG: phosphatase PAP2 family protein [Muribaculaceae bacterium]|nr:phosphatase PAP2 family protein [Muribaculaceae bacterium]